MLLEERDYRIRAGYLGDFVECYRTLGLPIQRAHLGEPVGFFTSEIGELNHFVSLWRWKDLAERTRRHQAAHRYPGHPLPHADRIFADGVSFYGEP